MLYFLLKKWQPIVALAGFFRRRTAEEITISPR
jgi:hypothetical protein